MHFSIKSTLDSLLNVFSMHLGGNHRLVPLSFENDNNNKRYRAHKFYFTISSAVSSTQLHSGGQILPFSFTSLVLRFSHFLWEAWSQVISRFPTSNVNKNRFHCLIECHINTIIYKQKRNNLVYLLSYKLGKTAGSLQASYLAISCTCGYLFDSVHFVG